MDVKTSSPLLPLRDIVVFPSMVIPLFVGRDKSISALNEVMKKEKKIEISKFGTFFVRSKKSRIGRNPKTKEKKIISERKVVLFKPSKELKRFINIDNDR